MGRTKGSTNKPKVVEMEDQTQDIGEMDDAVIVEHPVVVQSALPTLPATLTPMAMIERAVTNGASIEVLEKLLDLQDRWDNKQARRAFDEAMANAKAEIPTITKNRAVDFTTSKGRTNYKYEDLESVASAVGPILSKFGLSYRYRATSNVNEPVTVTCIISHRAGHFEELTLAAGRDESGNKNSIQAISSTMTYLQRISLKAALGLAVSNDDDGNSSEEPKRDQAPPRSQQTRQDPISSGPARDAGPPRQKPKDAGPSEGPLVPHQIPGKDETYESWCEKYVEMVKTSPDASTVYAWIDANRVPLDRIAKGKPSVSAIAKKAAEQTLESLRPKEPEKTPPAVIPTDPEAILAQIDAELAAVESADELEGVWAGPCADLMAKLDFPPDADAAAGLLRKHETRLTP